MAFSVTEQLSSFACLSFSLSPWVFRVCFTISSIKGLHLHAFRFCSFHQQVENVPKVVSALVGSVFLECVLDPVGVLLLLPSELGLDLFPLSLGEEFLDEAKVRPKLLQGLEEGLGVVDRPLLRSEVARVTEGAELVARFFDPPLRFHDGLHLRFHGKTLLVDDDLAVHNLNLGGNGLLALACVRARRLGVEGAVCDDRVCAFFRCSCFFLAAPVLLAARVAFPLAIPSSVSAAGVSLAPGTPPTFSWVA